MYLSFLFTFVRCRICFQDLFLSTWLCVLNKSLKVTWVHSSLGSIHCLGSMCSQGTRFQVVLSYLNLKRKKRKFFFPYGLNRFHAQPDS